MSSSINIAILGASGYTGVELLRFLLTHPHVKIAALSGDSQAGKEMAEVFPHLGGLNLPTLKKIDEIDYTAIDLVFCCLPHATTQEVIDSLLPLPMGEVSEQCELGEGKKSKAPSPASLHSATSPSGRGLKVIDLSADFRLKNPETYALWYGHTHQAIALQEEAIYGLTEHARAEIKSARLVANPGCYPTASQLPLLPLLKNKLIQTGDIIIDAKSGVTGAGRKASQNLLYTELNDSFSAYGIGNHRHTPEIEQGLSEAAGAEIQVRFTPHLVPMNRGILATIYVSLAGNATVDDLRNTLQKSYANEPFIRVLDAKSPPPSTAMVRGSNLCVMGVYADRMSGKAILVSAIDNLVKGASGQAVQNMNVMFGWNETLGVPQVAVFP